MDPSKKPDPYALDASQPGAAPGGEAPAGPGGAASRITTEVKGNVHIVTFSQNDVLDAFEIEELGNEIKRYVEGIDTPRVVINLAPVAHLSSAALGMLISTKTSCDARGGGVCLANVRDDLKQIFRLTNLHKLLRIHESTDAAVQSLA